MADVAMTGPIPGENYTSDTKNYPWHRPPEHTDVDEAIEAAFEKLSSPEAAPGMLTMVEAGMTIATLTDMFLTSGMGKGKWTMDTALLMAGPVAHIMCLMCKSYGIKYDLGVKNKQKSTTVAYFNEIKADKKKKDEMMKAVQTVTLDDIDMPSETPAAKPSGGFGSGYEGMA